MPKTAILEEQLQTLRGLGQTWVSLAAPALFALPALLAFYRALTAREYGLLPIALGLCAFALIVGQGAWHTRRAIRGIDAADRRAGTARIWIEESSDSTYHLVEVTIPRRGKWAFQFARLGDELETTQLHVVCHFLPEVEWPVLLCSEQGAFFPIRRPERLVANHLT